MKKIIAVFLFISVSFSAFPQADLTNQNRSINNDEISIIPDKVFEFGIPLLLLFLVLNTIVTVLKHRGEQQLKMKMLEKGIREETLVQIFKTSDAITKLQPLKWLLFTGATGLALILIYFFENLFQDMSGYPAVGIILLCNSIAFFIYYKILSQKV